MPEANTGKASSGHHPGSPHHAHRTHPLRPACVKQISASQQQGLKYTGTQVILISVWEQYLKYSSLGDVRLLSAESLILDVKLDIKSDVKLYEVKDSAVSFTTEKQ